MRSAAILTVLGMLVGTARADIYESQDSQGVHHYTNLKDDAGAAAVVFLREPTPRAGEPVPAAPAGAETAAPSVPKHAPVVYDQRALDAAFEQGWREGLSYVHEVAAGNPVSVHIEGPFVAAINNAPVPPRYLRRPLVTTSFDRGRSRHLTLRLLLQEQFAREREGPIVARQRLSRTR